MAGAMANCYCFYRMTDDAGSAPNPFHGVCTLAICTPNHQRARLRPGNVIVGVEADRLIERRRKKNGPHSTPARCLVYYMMIDAILDLDSYFRDARFAKKVPDPGGSLIAACGDNCYYRDDDGVWCSVPGHPHEHDETLIGQDQRGNRVFIGRRFYYFGDRAVPLPEELERKFVPQRGIKYCHHPLPGFDRYVETEAQRFGKAGRLGDPVDMTRPGCLGSPLTSFPRRRTVSTAPPSRSVCRRRMSSEF